MGVVARAGSVLRAVRPADRSGARGDDALAEGGGRIHLLPGDAASVTRLRGILDGDVTAPDEDALAILPVRRDTDLTIGAPALVARRRQGGGAIAMLIGDDAERAEMEERMLRGRRLEMSNIAHVPSLDGDDGRKAGDRRDPAPPGRRGRRLRLALPGAAPSDRGGPDPPPRPAVRRDRRAALPGRRHARHHPHPDPPGRRARGHVRVPLRSRTCARRARPVRGGVRLARASRAAPWAWCPAPAGPPGAPSRTAPRARSVRRPSSRLESGHGLVEGLPLDPLRPAFDRVAGRLGLASSNPPRSQS